MAKFGVSPAWFLSMFGEDFTNRQAASSLALLKQLGFEAWQPEIFRPSSLVEWERGDWRILKDTSDDLGLHVSQFVAHFLLHGFSNPENLSSGKHISECERLMGALEDWPEIGVITIPLPAFETGKQESFDEETVHYERMVEKLAAMCRLVESSGRICGLEILPDSLVGGSEGVRRIRQRENLGNICVNLDTGHFHAAGEPLDETLERIGDVVSGTHLCDNDGITNTSDEPGNGTIDWKVFADWYADSGYEESLDIEIRCEPSDVKERYRKGLDFLSNLNK